jgi:hypothetical protein
MPWPRTAWLVVPAVAAVLLSGCAGTHTVGADRTLRVDVTEYRISPNNVHVRPGPLTIVIHNYGRLTHDLVITRGGPEGGPKQASIGTVWPGQTTALEIYLPRGHYTMSSTIISDQALGAYGALTVG